MNSENYKVDQIDPFVYEFNSNGNRGNIPIIVVFTPMSDSTFNLGFGVWKADTNYADDLTETRNGDADKILGTVAQIALDFLENRPLAKIYATGSCARRTRKYQMGINKNLSFLNEKYIIRGLVTDRTKRTTFNPSYPNWRDNWQDVRSGVNYDAFLLYLK
ncbi:DUF6934 family protein [Dyadobacter sp. CY326]|uniref:DUF6934 family protein n=1 Tax=Dyadobacter sp. CY326 TaxID=2907300 RepID=UPI001F45DC9F|nr:hypothetical protein [Dyadobacter sp. CY326]MCE7063969.1 hypothetical protein [Dyadobacter sp. CY326]